MREDGFYWVKYDGEWTIAEWWGITWCVLNDRSVACVDLDFEQIDERRIERLPTNTEDEIALSLHHKDYYISIIQMSGPAHIQYGYTIYKPNNGILIQQPYGRDSLKLAINEATEVIDNDVLYSELSKNPKAMTP